jgi:serine/threonine protein kinase
MPSKQKPLIFNTTAESYSADGIEGEGATSVVYRVRDSEGKHWALKCLKADQATSSRTKRFLNELHFCRNSSHKNVIRVIDQGFVMKGDKKCPFFVMPRFPSTLRKMITSGSTPERALYYFSKLLDGVEAAHLMGVWHRDLKPENVLHDPSADELIVSDFGIAHFQAEAMITTVETRPQERLANFQYAAPEQRVSGGNVDARSDIYALGLMLNEMVTGHVPHGTGFRQIAQVLPGVEYLDRMVDRMIQNAPENRPSSIDEIKRSLIAGQNDFVSRQKLDHLKQVVVPAATVVDSLVTSPPELLAVDVEGEGLVMTLTTPVNSEWIQGFNSQRSYTALNGAQPHLWTFQREKARLQPPRHIIENSAQMLVDHFKNYLAAANELYKSKLEARARQGEEDAKRSLQKQIADEQWRNRVRGQIKL